jgi:hypothetical protein
MFVHDFPKKYFSLQYFPVNMICKLPPLVWLRKTLLWLGVFLCLVILCFASPVGAADVSADIPLPTHKIFVTTLRDRGNGSLRKAIEQANRNPDEIDLSRVSGAIGGNGGNGGFGGGGGSGFGGNGSHIGIIGLTGKNSLGGFGAGNGASGFGGGGGGFGGAIFMHGGTLRLSNVTFQENMAIAGEGAQPG